MYRMVEGEGWGVGRGLRFFFWGFVLEEGRGLIGLGVF